MSELTIDIRGEELRLLAERAAYWERTRTLLIADAHFGKAAAFRAASIPVPHGTTSGTIARLDAIVRQTGARRVIFLGDFLHARTGRSPEMLARFQRWHDTNTGIDLVLVRGNHDRQAGDPPGGLGVTCVDAPLVEPPFVFAHHPVGSADGYVIAGHVHPGVRLVGSGRQRERLPCFWFGESTGILPAFGEFTGLADVEPAAGDRVFVVAGADLVETGSAAKEA